MVVNGKNVALAGKAPLDKYLSDSGYELGRIAVEKNGVIVPKNAFASEILSDGDTLEIVCFVGGG